MPRYEYKVLKIPHNQQTFYCSHLSCFGWQVQNIQENVDRVVNTSMGFSRSTNFGSFNARTHVAPVTRNMYTSGYQSSHGWGSQMGTTVTNVQTSLTVTFFRDEAIPYRNDLIGAENRFWAAAKPYLERVDRAKKWGGDEWDEWKALQGIIRDGRAILDRKPAQAGRPVSEPKPAPPALDKQAQNPVLLPDKPATAEIHEVEAIHNVFQSDQPGMQIRLTFTIHNRKLIQGRAITYFFDSTGKPLKDLNQRFSTQDGNVSVGRDFTPAFDDTIVRDYILFMPYSELDLPEGDWQLGLQMKLYDPPKKDFPASSNVIPFRFIRQGKTLRGEAIHTPAPATTPVQAPRAKARPSRAARSVPAPAAVKTKSIDERIEEYREKLGWKELTEDRKAYLEALRADFSGERAAAITGIRKAIALNPKEAFYRLMLAGQYERKAGYGQMIKALKDGLEQLPDDPGLLAGLGRAHLLKGEPDKAEAVIVRYEAALAGKAEPGVLYLRGQLAETRQEYDAALRFYDQADALVTDPEMKKYTGNRQKYCREKMKSGK